MKMPAVRWHGRLDVRVEDVPEPEEPRPGMVLINVEYCGLCGTDLAEYLHGPVLIRKRPHPLTGRKPPLTMGHEFVGRIARLGDGVDSFSEDERVTADACWRCGVCHFCVRGDYHQCILGGSIGLHSDGGLALRVEVPAYTLVRVPDNVDDRSACLTEPLAVGFHAVSKADLTPGDTVAVVGFGPIGAAAALAAAMTGARVIIVEPLAKRQVYAETLGFSDVIDPSTADLRGEVRSLTNDLGADAVIDCTGKQMVVPQSLELTRRGGTLVVAGLGEAPASLDFNRIVLFERRVLGSLGYRHDLPRVLDLMATGRLDATRLISDTIPLTDAVDHGLRALAEDRGSSFKIVVRCR